LLAHNLPGQTLGETGLLGAAAFLGMVAVTLWNCRRVRQLCRDSLAAPQVALSGFAVACADVILLLFFEGLFLHNMTRFNWLWLAAFASHALFFMALWSRQRRQPVFRQGQGALNWVVAQMR